MRFTIVIPTMKTEDEYKSSHFFHCLERLKENTKYQVNIDICSENKTGLSELYQNKINQIVSRETDDYVIFIHDDLEIHDQFLFEKLLKAHEQYDIVGLAGAVSQNYQPMYNPKNNSEVPLVWHLKRDRPEDSRGFVSHAIPKGFNKCLSGHINSAYFGPTPSKVVVMDGLFMSFKISSLQNKDEIFDRDFTFHFYDMAACVNANKLGLTMGVYPIFCIHHGLGEFDSDPTWHRLQTIFKQKYKDERFKINEFIG